MNAIKKYKLFATWQMSVNLFCSIVMNSPLHGWRINMGRYWIESETFNSLLFYFTKFKCIIVSSREGESERVQRHKDVKCKFCFVPSSWRKICSVKYFLRKTRNDWNAVSHLSSRRKERICCSKWSSYQQFRRTQSKSMRNVQIFW